MAVFGPEAEYSCEHSWRQVPITVQEPTDHGLCLKALSPGRERGSEPEELLATMSTRLPARSMSPECGRVGALELRIGGNRFDVDRGILDLRVLLLQLSLDLVGDGVRLLDAGPRFDLDV